jgi:FkbM family methyltransferase
MHDEYQLGRYSGVGVDVGAHIGVWSIALALDNPDLRVIAIEPVPDNVVLMRENLERAGVSDRVTVLERAASHGRSQVPIYWGHTGSETAEVHRFIGGQAMPEGTEHITTKATPISLSAIFTEYGWISILKIDCEGCEWSFLDDPAIDQVGEIRGEWHTRKSGNLGRLYQLLDKTHKLTVSDVGGFGLFSAVIR